ncbi:MAG: pyridoxamine 5'-phosphate oxidase [Acuticoccus sp.]
MNATHTDTPLIADQATDPFQLFDTWYEAAGRSEPNDPNAMALATADGDGLPDIRMVLLKGHDARGFVFYTNSHSAKGGELAVNPKAALLFHWKSLRRQVRVRGPVTLVSDAEADAYFASRPRGSQVGAWASDQSRPLADRATLETRVAEREAAFGDTVPRPPHWLGYRIAPLEMEFWQDGAFRLHDRFRFRQKDGGWDVARLYP